MEKKFLKAFVSVVRDQIIQKNEVALGDLGYFRGVHLKQRKKQYKDGRMVMMPPVDRIEFIPKKHG